MKVNQCGILLSYLLRNGSIDAKEAVKELGIKNLAARVSDLRYMGMHIRVCKGRYILPNSNNVNRKVRRVLVEDGSSDLLFNAGDE